MEQQQQQEEEGDERIYELRQLKMNYLFHLIVFALIIILHFIVYKKLFWIINIYDNMYLYGTIFFILLFLYPIIPLTFILLHRFKSTNLKRFKIITFVIGIICILLGFYFCIVIWINTAKSLDFNKECPFNYSLESLEKIFTNYLGKDYSYNDDELDSKCINKRCILFNENQENKYPYQYLCNYDATENFKNKKNKIYTRTTPSNKLYSTDNLVECVLQETISDYDNIGNKKVLSEYFEICYNTIDFYNCSRFYEPKKYSISDNDVCPDSQYLFLLYILCGASFIIDVIIIALPWVVEFLTYKRLIIIFDTPTRLSPNSVNSTNRSSEIRNDENNEENFRKENTEYIIVEQPESVQNQNQQKQVQTSLLKVSMIDVQASVRSNLGSNNINNINNNNIINDVIKEDEKEEEKEKENKKIGVIGNPSLISFGRSVAPDIMGETQTNFAKKISLNPCIEENIEDKDSDRNLIKKSKKDLKTITISSSNGSMNKNNEINIKNDEDSKEEIKPNVNNKENIKKSVLVIKDFEE